MKEVLFKFSGADAMPQFMVLIGITFTGSLIVPALLAWANATAWLLVLCVFLVIILGFRFSISVTPSQVTITKRWFFVGYRSYKATAIDDVWFGGDWGEAHGAAGIVVKLKGQEVDIGSPWSMHYLHKSLSPLTTLTALRREYVAQQGIQPDGPASGGSAS